jgi:L-iditol 2-dehydrogenase
MERADQAECVKALELSVVPHLQLVEMPDPLPGEDEVSVCVIACGICGSDLRGLDGRNLRLFVKISKQFLR